jgi:SAM-dependent methyltransferase
MSDRAPQLAYSELQPNTKDEVGRRSKARKMIAILEHFLGVSSLQGLTVLDLGSSTGFIASEFHRHGASVIGSDIDVPGLANAATQFPDEAGWLCAAGEHLPLAADSVDLVVFNHVYEHVLDPVQVVSEIRRVLRPGGVVFLGLSNRLSLIEPHVRLPFASWLPPSVADRYVRLMGRGDRYHERLRTRIGLRELLQGFGVWEYTYTVIAEPASFGAVDVVHGPLARVPWWAAKMGQPFIPTYLWVGALDDRAPAGPTTKVPPKRLLRATHVLSENRQ